MLEHHLNCAQSLVSTYCEDFGLDRNQGLKVAMGFGGGMARTGKTCGAVTGAYIILGLSQRVNENNPRESIERTYRLIHDFNRQFLTLHGSLLPAQDWWGMPRKFWKRFWLLIKKHQHDIAVLHLVITPFDVLFPGLGNRGFTA